MIGFYWELFLSARKTSTVTKCNRSPFCTYTTFRLIESLLNYTPHKLYPHLTRDGLMRQNLLCLITNYLRKRQINARQTSAYYLSSIQYFFNLSDYFSSTGIYLFLRRKLQSFYEMNGYQKERGRKVT